MINLNRKQQTMNKSNKRNRKQPDITVVVYGKKGIGKSSLIGEIGDFLTAHACKVVCVEGPAGGPKKQVALPAPGRFHARPLKVKLVEQWIDGKAAPRAVEPIRIPCEWICPECGQMEEDELAREEHLCPDRG